MATHYPLFKKDSSIRTFRFKGQSSRTVVISFLRTIISFFLGAVLISYVLYFSVTRPVLCPLPLLEEPTNSYFMNHAWQLFVTSPEERNASATHAEALKAASINTGAVSSWMPVDGSWIYSFVGTEAAESFVRTHFANHPDIIAAFASIELPVMRSDFLRYLLLGGAGGVYADDDVALVKPLHQWIPDEYKDATRAVIGIESDQCFDKPSEKSNTHSTCFVQLCQYALASVKGHPIMMNMARNITDEYWARRQNLAVQASGDDGQDIKLHDKDVMKITGPWAFTQIVYEHLSQQTGEEIGWRNISGITEPKLFGDTLIMPVWSFASGQNHSGSKSGSPDARLVQHYWRGKWRHWDESLKHDDVNVVPE